VTQHAHYTCDTCQRGRCTLEDALWTTLRFRRRSGPEVRYEPVKDESMTCKWCMNKFFGKVSAG